MLPSGIAAPADSHAATRVQPGTLTRGTGLSGATTAYGGVAHGPLATKALRALGIAPVGQAYASWSQPTQTAALGGPGAAPFATSWLAARALPTPNGYYRSAAVTQQAPRWIIR